MAALVAKAVRQLAVPALTPARAAVGEGRLSVAAGCVVAAELAQLRPLLQPGADDAVLAGLVTIGERHGCAGVRQVRPALLARYGLGEKLPDDDERRAGMNRLSCGPRHRRRDHRVPDAGWSATAGRYTELTVRGWHVLRFTWWVPRPAWEDVMIHPEWVRLAITAWVAQVHGRGIDAPPARQALAG